MARYEETREGNTPDVKLNRLGEKRGFTLTYENSIEEPENLFRCGNKRRPIKDLRCDYHRRQYDHHNRLDRPADFQIDGNGCVNVEQSKGNFCSQYTTK